MALEANQPRNQTRTDNVTRQGSEMLFDYVARVGQMVQEDIAGLQRDIEGPICDDCGGVQTSDTTPSYVFKQMEICDCVEENDV
jgi:hypothetical protein